MPKTAAQVLLERYGDEVNNRRKLELIRELCSDLITRHDPGSVTKLSHDEQIERVRVGIEKLGVQTSRVITHADESTVTSVWNMTMTKHDDKKMCGIEVFKVENGRLTHCWNTPYSDSHWS